MPPNNAQLAKAERILHDIENGLYKIIDISGIDKHRELYNLIMETEDKLSEFSRLFVELTGELCRMIELRHAEKQKE